MARSSQWRRDASIPFHLLQNEFLRFLEDYLQQPQAPGSAQSPTDLESTGWIPSIDIYETPEETLVVAEIPGVDPAKIELSATGNQLQLRGIKEPSELSETLLHARERLFGTFHRQVTLPSEVDFDAAQAEAKNGILTVRLPKRQAEKPRTIPIRPS